MTNPTAQKLDAHATISESPRTDEMRDFARVIKAALGMLVAHWNQTTRYPAAHPYRQAARMVICFLERRYGV